MPVGCFPYRRRFLLGLFEASAPRGMTYRSQGKIVRPLKTFSWSGCCQLRIFGCDTSYNLMALSCPLPACFLTICAFKAARFPNGGTAAPRQRSLIFKKRHRRKIKSGLRREEKFPCGNFGTKVERRRRSRAAYCLKRWCPRPESNRHAFKGGGFSSYFGFRRRRSMRRS